MVKAKIIFFGSFDFAMFTMEKLLTLNNYEIVAIVTNPDKPIGRKKIIGMSPVKAKALAFGLKIFQPEKLKGNQDFFHKLRDLNPDLGMAVGYSKILPQEVLDIPRLGILNIHPSLLSKYRGPSPVQTAILNGETKTGVTIMKVDAEVDHGPLLGQKELEIKPEDTTVTLFQKLFQLGTDLLLKVLPDYISGKLIPSEQKHDQATFTKMIKAEDGEIKTTDTIQKALNKIRALNPEPGTFTILSNGKRLKIIEATSIKDSTKPILKLKDGLIELVKVQPEGGKPMTGLDWQRGQKNINLKSS